MEDLIYRAILVFVICLAAWLCYRWMGYDQAIEKEYPPQYFDPDDPGDLWEYRAILEQRKYGRERGSMLILQNGEAANDD